MEVKYKSVDSDLPMDLDRITLICEDCPAASMCNPQIKDKVDPDGTKIISVNGTKTNTDKCKLPLVL